MQVVILAAGKGTRLRPLTNEIPKTLLPVAAGITIADKLIEALPDEVTEIVFAIHHLGDKIKQHYGDSLNGRKIIYAEQPKLDGSAKALWAAKDKLKGDFLVLNGDDIYLKEDLEKLVKEDLAVLGFHKEGQPSAVIELNEKGFLKDIVDYPEVTPGSYLTNTGAYKLNQRFFDYDPVPMQEGSDEYGLPQTLSAMAKDYPVKVIEARGHLQINDQEQLEMVKKYFSTKN